jgi:hypothetical protein
MQHNKQDRASNAFTSRPINEQKFVYETVHFFPRTSSILACRQLIGRVSRRSDRVQEQTGEVDGCEIAARETVVELAMAMEWKLCSLVAEARSKQVAGVNLSGSEPSYSRTPARSDSEASVSRLSKTVDLLESVGRFGKWSRIKCKLGPTR